MRTLFRLGSHSREETPGLLRRQWLPAFALQPRRAHVIAAALAAIIIVPAGYIAYCMATLPVGGGLVIEPTPSAVVRNAWANCGIITEGEDRTAYSRK